MKLMLIWAKISLFMLFFLITFKVYGVFLADSVPEQSDRICVPLRTKHFQKPPFNNFLNNLVNF